MPQVLGMGIDTGGSNTQSVIMNLDKREIIETGIASTTPFDLSVGIINSINNALGKGSVKGDEIKLVSVSTTLVTNSILQNKGWEVGKILIQPGEVKEEDLEEAIEQAFVRGGHDLMGEAIEPLDEQAVRSAVKSMANRVKAFAVSAYFGCRNPEYEVRTREIITEMTGLPVVCGHEMSPRLGMDTRTTTAYLNARLLPIIKEFLDKMNKSLVKRNINAPLMVVKSDGSLTSEAIAREKPVETMLSGTAASAVGAVVLSKLKDFIVIDVGGTSTDIGMVINGLSQIDSEGGSVGDWRTRVRALSMRTVGLAGDSRIWMNKGSVWAGPERVIPLCLAAKKYPKLLGKIESKKCTDFLIAHSARNADFERSEQETFNAIELLQPVTFAELAKEMDRPAALMQNHVQKLKSQYTIEGVGLTPTDLFHFQGAFTEWDVEASKKGVSVFASNLGISQSELASRALNFVYNLISKEIVKKLLYDEIGEKSWSDSSEYLLDKAASSGGGRFGLKITANYPIVAIGGPVGLLMPPVCERLNTKLVLPPYYAFGNAVGAISGVVVETVTVQIIPNPAEEGQVRIFGLEKPLYLAANEAKNYALTEATKLLKERAVMAGMQDPHIETQIKPLGEGTEIIITATGTPALGK